MSVSLPSRGLLGTKKKFKPHGKFRPLAIKYTGETETDKPVKCTISSEEIPFHLLRPDGKDAVFLDENGNILPYWIETKNSTLMQVWLKFPKVSKSFLPVYMYYNNLRDVKLSHISAAFKYRRKITITEQSGEDLSDYQVCIELDSSNFDFSHTQTDGSDIRFIDGNGSLLCHWIENWDADNERAKIWIKIPSLPANSVEEIYMYYGNSEITDASSGDDVFDFFDDFDSEKKAKIIKKIYSCENGAYGDNEDGKPCALGPQPIVAIYVPSQEKVYIAYQGEDYDPYIFYYDVENDSVSSAVKVGENPTADSRWGDCHASPTLWLDPDGYIHVLYGGHGTAIKHKKSTNPYDISSWTSLSDFASEGTYPYPVVDGSRVFVFYRHDNVRWYKKSTDGGDSFESDIKWCDTGGVYYNYVRKGNKVHFVMRYSGTGDWAKQLRYFYFDLNTETFHKMDGTQLSTPFSFDDADLIWTSPSEKAAAAAIGADDDGHIYIIAYARGETTASHADIYAIKWDGSSWQSKDTGLDVKFGSGNFHLAVKSSDDIDLYFVQMDENGCGPYYKYTSSNGLDYTLKERIADTKACRYVYTVCNEDTEPIGGITFDKIITVNNVDSGDPHLGLYGTAFQQEEGNMYSVIGYSTPGEFFLETENSWVKTDTSNKHMAWKAATVFLERKYIVETEARTEDDDAVGVGWIQSGGKGYAGVVREDPNYDGGIDKKDSILEDFDEPEALLSSEPPSVTHHWYYIKLSLTDEAVLLDVKDLENSYEASALLSDTTYQEGSPALISGGNNPEAYFKYLRVRKYASTEPDISVGQEEEI